MAENSTIEWTDATWNPITGCSVVSPGCTNCYAMGLAGTRLKHHPSRAGLTVDTKAGPVWNGQVRLNEQWLTQPLLWKRPRKIFVCAHGDLFAEGVPDAWIDRVFAVMAASPQHTMQVLTKRSARMRAYLSAPDVVGRIIAALQALSTDLGPGRSSRDPRGGAGWNAFAAAENLKLGNEKSSWPLWPLKHVWLGVSAEDQRRANERVPHLLGTPAAVRFVSAEPLLGPLDLWLYLDPLGLFRHRLDWLIVGGESGPSARPMHPAWARSIRDQCEAAGVAFHFKQWGAWGPTAKATIKGDAVVWPNGRTDAGNANEGGGGGREMIRVGKKLAGRLLDGVEHNGMPGGADA